MSEHSHFSDEKIEKYIETHCLGREVAIRATREEATIYAVEFTPNLTGSSLYYVKTRDGREDKVWALDLVWDLTSICHSCNEYYSYLGSCFNCETHGFDAEG